MSLFGKIFRRTAAAASVALGTGSALAQEPVALPPALPEPAGFPTQDPGVTPVAGFGRGGLLGNRGTQCCPPNYYSSPHSPYIPTTPCPITGLPLTPGMVPPGTMPPDMVVPTPPGTTPDTTAPPAAPAAPSLAGLGRGADVGQTVGIGGYLDNPIPITTVRLRFDAAWGVNRPDRAQFFWAPWEEMSSHPHAIIGDKGNVKGAFFDPGARGPEHFFRTLNYQELAPYLEFAFTDRLSMFVDLPSRFLQTKGLLEDPDNERQVYGPNAGKFFPEVRPPGENNNLPRTGLRTSGFSDMNAGLKYAFIANPNRVVTFQFRTYIPTGDPSLGLGVGHASLEPGLLYYQRLSSRLVVQGQLRDWIPIGGSRSTNDPTFTIGGGVTSNTGKRFDGNILIYGLGAGYDVIQRGRLRVTPVGELVGWTAFNGLESIAAGSIAGAPVGVDLPNTHLVHDVAGTTIINAKFGLRTSFGDGHSIYVGYGRALTGAVWYKDIFRLEYRRFF